MFRRLSKQVVIPVAGPLAGVALRHKTTAPSKGADSTATPEEIEYYEMREALKKSVLEHLSGNRVYSQVMIARSVDRFFGLGVEWTYVKAFDAKTVAKHVLGFITATAEFESGKPFEYAFEGDDMAFWLCECKYESQLETERAIERYVLAKADAAKGKSLRSFSSPGGNTTLYVMVNEDFPNGAVDITAPLEKACTKSFWKTRSSASKERYSNILSHLKGSIVPVYSIREVEDDQLNVTMGFLPDRSSYLTALTTLFNSVGATINKRFMETFAGGQQVYSFFIKGAPRVEVERVCMLIGMLPHRPENAVTKLYNNQVIAAHKVTFCYSLIIFAFYFTPPTDSPDFNGLANALKDNQGESRRLKKLRLSMHQELMSEDYITSVLEKNVDFVKRLYDQFSQDLVTSETAKPFYEEIDALDATAIEKNILNTFVRFCEAVVKTNYFKVKRAAVAYRLDPKIFMKGLDYPTMPHGIFFIVGAQFRGFHVRFHDIARGGIRMILSNGPKYRTNRLSLFQENYNLSHAQLLKNKDIPESGSKGTILVSQRRGPNPKVMYLQYIDAILDLLLPGEEGVRDELGQQEILFMGPDENTAGELPTIAANHARERGYKQWKSFTTGKGQDIGGIPHEIYGMTTESVRANVQAIYKEHGLVETDLVKFQTGGPDGDLGSNEILLSKEKYIGLVDISGVLYDPNGVNRDELVRLAKGRPDLRLEHFDTSKLGKGGFFVNAKDKHVTLPDGTHVASGEKFRDEFHFSEYLQCDVFVPCGGRPNAVTIDNVHRFLVNCPEFTGDTMLYGKVGDLASKGKTRFKYIVEGANLFITQEARLALENVGVVIVKDSSANKGGVTSSSIEVLSALALTDEEFKENMCVKDGVFPKFYNKIVEEIIERIRHNATREFECISREVAKGSLDGHRTLIADELSRRIVRMRVAVLSSNMFDAMPFRRFILSKYVPKSLLDLVGIDQIIQRVPENYLRACFATYIASDYVYTKGINASEFDFFEYMHELHVNCNECPATK